MIETLFAIVTAIAVIIITRLLSKHFSAKLIAATLLCSMAFIYVGFSLQDNPVSSIFLEVLVAIIFYFIAIIGYSKNSFLIAYGIMLHGIWDIFHHNGLPVATHIPSFWPFYCAAIDIIWGIYFYYIFKRERQKI